MRQVGPWNMLGYPSFNNIISLMGTSQKIPLQDGFQKILSTFIKNTLGRPISVAGFYKRVGVAIVK